MLLLTSPQFGRGIIGKKSSILPKQTDPFAVYKCTLIGKEHHWWAWARPCTWPWWPSSTKTNAADQNNPSGGCFPQDMPLSLQLSSPGVAWDAQSRLCLSTSCLIFFLCGHRHGAWWLKGAFEDTIGWSRTVASRTVTWTSLVQSHSLSWCSVKWKVAGRWGRRAAPSWLLPPSSSRLGCSRCTSRHREREKERQRKVLAVWNLPGVAQLQL